MLKFKNICRPILLSCILARITLTVNSLPVGCVSLTGTVHFQVAVGVTEGRVIKRANRLSKILITQFFFHYWWNNENKFRFFTQVKITNLDIFIKNLCFRVKVNLNVYYYPHKLNVWNDVVGMAVNCCGW